MKRRALKNYGYVKPVIEEKAWKFGSAIPLSEAYVLRSDGQYDSVLYEPQAEKYETWGCTDWGGQNQIEIYMKTKFGFEPNYWEQFNYILAGIKEGGGDPHVTYESFRNDGLVPQDGRTMPPTYNEFKDPEQITPEIRALAKKFLDEYVFKHEWITVSNPAKMKQAIKSALRFGPIGLSVTAWIEENGLYIDEGKPNTHWCVCIGYKEDERGLMLKIFDSYDHSIKWLHPDHHVECAKRIYIAKKISTEKEQLSLLSRILQALKEILGLQSKLIEQTAKLPTPLPEPKNTSIQDQLKELCLESLGKDASPLNRAPSDLSCAEGLSTLLNQLFPDFAITVSTTDLYYSLKKDTRFAKVKPIEPWSVIISPTGMGNGSMPGHAGIVGENGIIYSNNSKTGKWDSHFTIDSWKGRYRDKGGLPIYIFKLL